MAILELVWACPYLAPRPDGSAGNVTAGDGEKVAGYRYRLLENIDVVRGALDLFRFFALAAGDDGERGADAKVKGGLDVWGVLAGKDGSRVDGLALRDCKYVQLSENGRLI